MSKPSATGAGPPPQRHCYDDIWRETYGDMQDVGPVHRHMRRLLARSLRSLEYRSVLDVGCGAGHNLSLLTEDRPIDRVTGVDVSETALGLAQREHKGDFRLLDIECERLPGTWDLVFSSLVLEHLPDDRAALANMASMARRHVVVSTIAGDFERHRAWEEQMGHVRNYRRGELEARMEDAGLRVRRASYWGFPFYSPIARTLQNRMTSEPEYNRRTRALAALMHAIYYLNSSRRGDLLIVVADAP